MHSRRIDYVFVGSSFVWKPRVVVRSCRVVLTDPAEGPPSDHYGVLADLEVDSDDVLGGGRSQTWAETATTLWPPR